MNSPKSAPPPEHPLPLHSSAQRRNLSWQAMGRWGGTIALGSAALLLLAALTPRRIQSSSEACAVTVYLTGDAFHANLTLPVHSAKFDWRDHLNLQEIGQGNNKHYAYLSFGWGDRQFYLNTPRLQDLSLNRTLRAFFWPTESVIHVQGHHSVPQSSEDGSYQVKALRLSSAAYARLTTHVQETFELSSSQRPQKIKQSHRYNGAFYEGNGAYGIWRTCNDWIAAGLRKANTRTPLWSGLSSSVFQQLQSNCLE